MSQAMSWILYHLGPLESPEPQGGGEVFLPVPPVARTVNSTGSALNKSRAPVGLLREMESQLCPFLCDWANSLSSLCLNFLISKVGIKILACLLGLL